MNEREAIARLKQGQIDGLETLVRLHQKRALQLSFAVCRDYPLAEDIVQSAFVRAYERSAQFDPARPFGPWFVQIVVNDTLKAVSRKQTVPLEGAVLEEAETLASLEPDLYEKLEAAETKQAIWKALDQLSPYQRAAIVLRYYLDMSDKEIAQTLECPPGTVRRRLHDARQRLRNLLPGWVRPA